MKGGTGAEENREYLFFQCPGHADLKGLLPVLHIHNMMLAAEFAVQSPGYLFLGLDVKGGGFKTVHLIRVDVAVNQIGEYLVQFDGIGGAFDQGDLKLAVINRTYLLLKMTR